MANVSTGQVIAANDHNSIVAAIKGTTGENLTVFTAGAQLVSASALTLPNDGNYWAVNGSATINTISTLPAGTVIKLRFNGVNVALAHSANIILSDAANYTTASGDVFEFISEGSGVWRETARSMYALTATIRGTPSLTFSTANNMGTGQFYLSRNATIALFDTTAARAVAFGDVGTIGGVNFASPRDHGHAFALGAAIVPSVGNTLSVASTNGTLGWVAGGATGAAGGDLAGTYPSPTVALTHSTNALAGDVTMTNAGTYYDGPSLTLAAGTWLLVGQVELIHALVPGDRIDAKLWDGTTPYAAGTDLRAAAERGVIALSAIVSPVGSTTYKISCSDSTGGGRIETNSESTTGNVASRLNAVKIA